MGGLSPWHWAVLAIVVIALVGYKKLPDATRSVGRSLRIFKSEIKGMTEDDGARDKARERVADDEQAGPRALPRAEIVPPAGAAPRGAERPRPRPAPAPTSGPRSVDAG